MDKSSPDLEKSKLETTRLTHLPQEPTGALDKGNIITPVKQSHSIKSGPLPGPPPTLKEWKASGKRGLPPLPYEIVIKDAPNNALEYELYHGFKREIMPREIEQRIGVLEKGQKSQTQRYTRAAIYYLHKKLEEFVVGD